ncbi:hypothetical protein R3P38DRAFT_3276306 [Favolaschia claudopus]|uniref:Uncharacterized protein n=1 Tax=Favolaschia claudopus TaxID=2862362 RepID=A0AAW0AUQ1_9AGAR
MAVKSGKDPKVFFRKAAQEYLTAASAYPEDDEHHPCMYIHEYLALFLTNDGVAKAFLNAALGHMFSAGTFPVREIMDVMKRIRLSVPKAKAIWERSSLGAGGVWDIFADVEKEEQKLRTSIAEGSARWTRVLGLQRKTSSTQ